MGISKSYQLFLFLVFAALFTGSYLYKRNEIRHSADSDLEQYTQYISQYQTWNAPGEQLYNEVFKQFPILFFQYIHAEDSRMSFTQGSLTVSNQSPFQALFPFNLKTSVNLDHGRLQVKLNCQQYIDDALLFLTRGFVILAASYLILALFFAFLAARHRKSIRYAADYIRSIPEFKFQALEGSKINGELAPITQALIECRLSLKKQLDNITLENEKLTLEKFQDPVTGFGTRQRFNEKLDEIATATKDTIGVLATIKATELNQINQLFGRNSGDDYLIRVVSCVRKALEKLPDSECYRVSSSDFAVFINSTTLKEASKFAAQLKILLEEYQGQIKSESVAYTGLVPFNNGADTVQLLSLAETSVGIAQTMGPNSFHVLEKLNGDDLFGDDRWRIAIDDIIKRRAIKFFHQQIQPAQSNARLYSELLSRFYNSDGKFLPTGTVVAMAERLGLVTEIDKIVILNTIRLLIDSPNVKGVFGINISTASAHQDAFIAWLTATLSKQSAISSRLVFEINETGMQTNISATFKFVRAVHRVGSRVSIEHFGTGFSSFKYFREVQPDYVKLDGSYSESIDEDSNNKFFVKMIVDIARRLNIRVIATSVERQEEKLVLEKLLVDGLQGYYIAQPQALVGDQRNRNNG